MTVSVIHDDGRMTQCVQGTTNNHWIKEVAFGRVHWKNITGFFITSKRKRRYAPEQKMCLRVCGRQWVDHKHTQTNTHTYTRIQEVPKTGGIMVRSVGSIKEVLGYKVLRTVQVSVLYLGNLTEENTQNWDRYLIKAMLAASKKTITRA